MVQYLVIKLSSTQTVSFFYYFINEISQHDLNNKVKTPVVARSVAAPSS